MEKVIIATLLLLSTCSGLSPNFRKAPPKSCLELQKREPKSPSGRYFITTSKGTLKVYCEMEIEGGGYTFIPRSALHFLTQADLDNLHTDSTNVLFRLKKTNGRQTYTKITQLPQFNTEKISVTLNSATGYTSPQNKDLGPYIFVGILPASIAAEKTEQGFTSNGQGITFKNCDANPNSYFTFLADFKNKVPTLAPQGSIYETSGVAVDWRNSAKMVYSMRYLSDEFFFLTEVHFGGCGCYTSSDRWINEIGTAIGLR